MSKVALLVGSTLLTGVKASEEIEADDHMSWLSYCVAYIGSKAYRRGVWLKVA